MYSGVFIDEGQGQSSVSRYKKRRSRLLKAVGHSICLAGVQHGPAHLHSWAHLSSPIFQDPFMLYLTGINQPGVKLILDASNQTEILFLPPYESNKVFWDGYYLGCGDSKQLKLVQKMTGFKDIRLHSDFQSSLHECLQKDPSLGAIWHQKKNSRQTIIQDEYSHFRRDLLRHIKKIKPTLQLTNVIDTLWPMVLALDETDQKNLSQAFKKTHTAFKQLLTGLHHCSSETEVSGVLFGALLEQSSFGLAFPPIVAHGKNACILHYTKNNSPLNKKHLLLLDFGLKWHSLNTDISRTLPLSGTFNPLQRLLYTLVLDTQKAVESWVSSGQTIATLNTKCWRYLDTLLEERFLSHGGKMKRQYHHQPHFVSHLIGHQVHDGDPSREYRFQPLQPNWMISNEPGLYGHFEMTLDGAHYSEDIGIRIEDNLLITKKGCVNLSADIPKEIEELEALL